MGPPANLPDFKKLCRQIAQGTGEEPSVPLDRFLGTLDHKRVLVHKRAAQALNAPNPKHKAIHADILRLFPAADQVKLVTTNFDTLFEEAASSVFDEHCEVFSAPALPIGSDFAGIIHLHGIIDQPSRMVLTDRDFGKAYLTDGWGRRFLVNLFMNYTVLFVGYRHDDVVIEYLTRALPRQNKHKQFILTSEGSLDKWMIKGITPIIFKKPSENDYSLLDDGVKKLASLLWKTVSDKENDIKEISIAEPPKDIEQQDIILRALREEYTTRFFTQNATAPGWPIWLNKKGILKPLFDYSCEYDHRAQLLSDWLASNYAIKHHNILFEVISGNYMRINDGLWRSIAWAISREGQQIQSAEAFCRWVTILCDYRPRLFDSHDFLFLAEQSSALKQYKLIPYIFKALIDAKISTKIIPREPGGTEDDNLFAEINDTADHYCVKEIVDKNIQPQLEVIYAQVFNICISNIRSRYEKIRSFRNINNNDDWESWAREAIEEDKEDRYENIIDLIIDAARMSIDYAAQHSTIDAEAWSTSLLREESNLLKRIGIHGINSNSRTSYNMKLDLISTEEILLDTDLRHELLRLLKSSYRHADDNYRHKLVEIIKSYFLSGAQEENESRSKMNFALLAELNELMPDCPHAKEAINALKERHPDWPLRSPERGSRVQLTEWVGHESPFPHEDLLSMDIREKLTFFLTYTSEEFGGPDRNGLLIELQKAAVADVDWSLNFASILSEQNEFACDLWPSLIKAWRSVAPQSAHNKGIFDWLHTPDIQKKHSRYISESLYDYVKDEKWELDNDVLAKLNAIASSHYENTIERQEKGQDRNEDWLQKAINKSSGILAEFWIHSLSQWGKINTDKTGIPAEYKTELAKMLSEKSISGGYFRSVICSQISFLIHRDEEWSAKNVIPLFTDHSNQLIMRQAWNGYLTWSRPTRITFSYLSETYLHFNNYDFLDENRSRFIEFLTTCIINFVDNNHADWIKTAFESSNIEDIMSFCRTISSYLRNAPEEHKINSWKNWLKAYIDGRIDGVPTTIDSKEIESMITWPLYLASIFDDAVITISKMPTATITHCSLVLKLKNNELTKTHPNSVFILLIYLSQCEIAGYCWHGIKEVMAQLRENDPNAQLENELVENLKKLGVVYE